VNKQLGLDNIKDISSFVTFIAKAELPTNTFLGMSQGLRAGPVMTFADKKAFYFAGTQHHYHHHLSSCSLADKLPKHTYQTRSTSTESG
jgi:hypothetical protein